MPFALYRIRRRDDRLARRHGLLVWFLLSLLLWFLILRCSVALLGG